MSNNNQFNYDFQLCNENFDLNDDSSWNKYSELDNDNSNEPISTHSSLDVYPLEELLQVAAAGISSHEFPNTVAKRLHDKVLFCNCPPDPELPKHLYYAHMR